MNFVFLMDPLETVDPIKDTTLVLMLGAQRAGHQVYFLPNGGLMVREGVVFMHVTKVQPTLDSEPPFQREGDVVLSPDDVDAVFIRTNPPFDERYLMNT